MESKATRNVMSHFTVLKAQITDTEVLVKALADLGFTKLEVHRTPEHLDGYLDDPRPQTAEVIIRRRNIGWFSSDIGFRRQEDRTLEAIISDYDRIWYSEKWLKRLAQCYAYHVGRTKLHEQGLAVVTEETQRNGQIHIVLRRMG